MAGEPNLLATLKLIGMTFGWRSWHQVCVMHGCIDQIVNFDALTF